MGTITMSEEEMDHSSRGRVYFWKVAVDMANANPLTGVGHMSYNPHYNEYDTSDGYYGLDRSVHSAWFGVIGELGYPGIVLFVLNLVWTLIALRQVRRLAKSSPALADLGEYAAAFEIAFAAFAVSASFISFQYVEMLWHYMGFSAALLWIARSEQAALLVNDSAPLRNVPGSQPADVTRPAARGRVAVQPAVRRVLS
jgi:O-antigen ligase